MTFPVQVQKLVKYSGGTTDVFLNVTGPGTSGGGQTAGTVVLTGIPTTNLSGVNEGNNYSMVIS